MEASPPTQKFNWLTLAALVLLFLTAAGIRLYDLQDLPLDFHPTRQLHSALMARGMYYQNLPDVPEWQRALAVQQWRAEGLIEPPIMERLAALTYRLAGGAYLWIPRLYAIFFWLLGGVGLWLWVRQFLQPDSALVALAYYLFIPYGIIASRAFQPEPLLVAAIAWAGWAIFRWQRSPTWKAAVLAGLLAGFAIFVKSVAVFFIGGILAGAVLGGMGLKKTLKSGQFWLLGVLTVLPYALFHIYGVYISGLLTSQFKLRFFPNLWLTPAWYLQWLGEAKGVLGFGAILLALLGFLLLRERPARWMAAGFGIGYLVYGFTFAYHISTHDYYQEPIIPLVGLGVGAAAGALFALVRDYNRSWFARAALVVLVTGTIILTMWDVRNTFKKNNYSKEAAIWQEIGETLGQGSAVIGITSDYGYRLAYWGWTNITNWMSTNDMMLRELAGQEVDVLKKFQNQVAGKDYFVVTQFNELNNQPTIKKLLYENYPIYKETGSYIIFDLKGTK